MFQIDFLAFVLLWLILAGHITSSHKGLFSGLNSLVCLLLTIRLRGEVLLSNFNSSALCRAEVLVSLALGLEEQKNIYIYKNNHNLKVKTKLSSSAELLRFARYGTSKNLWLQKYLPPEKQTC